MDKELLQAASSAVQAQENLLALLKSKISESSVEPSAKEALVQGEEVLQSSRAFKSRIEGTTFVYRPVKLDSSKLSQLKHLVLSHTPRNLHDSTKSEITDKLLDLFAGQVKQLLYACVLTCPWFAQAQRDVCAQARNNILYVVFVSRNEQFFTLATPHEQRLNETLDEGFLFACEVRHFCSLVCHGNVRSVEVLCSPANAVVMKTPVWSKFATLFDPVTLLHKRLVDSCVGQAVGSVLKKHPSSGKFVVKDEATLVKFCDSFRLLSYALAAVNKELIPLQWDDLKGNEEKRKEILSALEQSFAGIINKDHLLSHLLSLKDEVSNKLGELPKSGPKWSNEMGQWLAEMRMNGSTLTPHTELTPSERDYLSELLSSAGLSSITPDQVLVIAKGGSQMYNLTTPTSDTDYIIVYSSSTQEMIRSCSPFTESMQDKGRQAAVEMAAYESRLFCEMLLKGAVNMFEMLYSDKVEYASQLWKELSSQRRRFMTEQVVLQYIGFVQTHMNMIKKGTHKGTPRERKFFYQVFHKLLSLESFAEGGPPVVRCEGESREYIMRIRMEPLKGSMADELYSHAKQRLKEVRQQLITRAQRLPEFGDYCYLQKWLLRVRGVIFDEDLKMAVPAIATPSD